MDDPRHLIPIVAILAAACASSGHAQQGVLAPNAPVDRPVGVVGTSSDEALTRLRGLIAPQVQKALATYPDAKRRYLAGLPRGETFFVTTLLRDATNRFEQVFILVDRIESGSITGRIASDIQVVDGYRRGQSQTFAEANIIDWLISKADGSEEGNFVGKFLDTLPQSNR
jgi:hypothetical protein